MNCALALRMLDAHVDNELDASTAADMTAHLAGCAECAATYDRRLALRSALRSGGLRYDAPAGLRLAVQRNIRRNGIRHTHARGERAGAWTRVLSWWQATAFAACAAVAGAIGGFWIAQPHVLEVPAENAVSRHVASLSPEGPHIDIASSDRHVVRPWFQGRLEFAPRVRDLSAQGFDLVGARVDRIADRQAVAVVYKLHSHVITVFSWRGSDMAARTATVRGFNLATWTDADMNYEAVSDTDSVELQRFVTAYRAP